MLTELCPCNLVFSSIRLSSSLWVVGYDAAVVVGFSFVCRYVLGCATHDHPWTVDGELQAVG
jgi:hypothetical protein